jgi:hypothetical protein
LERLKVVILQVELSALKQENWQPTGLIFQIMGGEQTKKTGKMFGKDKIRKRSIRVRVPNVLITTSSVSIDTFAHRSQSTNR